MSNDIAATARCTSALLALLLTAACATDQRVSFNAESPAELETRVAHRSDGRTVTLVKASVDGKDLGWCLLDSGASSLLVAEEVMAGLDIPVIGGGPLPAPCTTDYVAHRAGELRVGPLTLPEPVLYSMSLRGLSAELDVELGGILGQPLFAAAVVRTEPAPEGQADKVSLHDPDSFVLPKGQWDELEFRGHHSVVLASHEGNPDEFVISTGEPFGVQFFAWATKRKRLLRHRDVESKNAMTLCGETLQREGDLANFIFAERRFNDLPARFMEPGSVLEIRDARVSGIVGREILRHFTVTLDYANHRAAFVPVNGN